MCIKLLNVKELDFLTNTFSDMTFGQSLGLFIFHYFFFFVGHNLTDLYNKFKSHVADKILR